MGMSLLTSMTSTSRSFGERRRRISWEVWVLTAIIGVPVSRCCRELFLLGREEVYAADVGRWKRKGELEWGSLGRKVANLEGMGHLFRNENHSKVLSRVCSQRSGLQR